MEVVFPVKLQVIVYVAASEKNGTQLLEATVVKIFWFPTNFLFISGVIDCISRVIHMGDEGKRQLEGQYVIPTPVVFPIMELSNVLITAVAVYMYVLESIMGYSCSLQVLDITERMYEYLQSTELGDWGIPSRDQSKVSCLIHAVSLFLLTLQLFLWNYCWLLA